MSGLFLGLGMPLAVLAQTPQTLAERRQAIIDGSAPGIVVLGGGQTKAKAAPGPATAPPPAPAPVASAVGRPGSGLPAQRDEPLPRDGWAWWKRLPPPSGKPLSEARTPNAAHLGIDLPTAASASRR